MFDNVLVFRLTSTDQSDTADADTSLLASLAALSSRLRSPLQLEDSDTW